MKVYGHPMSTCTRKVLTVLAEKGEKHEFVLVDLTKGEHKMPEHLSRQPFGVVPALDDDGFALFESRAMIRYLDEKFPTPALSPKDAKGRALMEQWISVEHSNFTPAAMKIIYQNLFNKMMGKTPDLDVVAKGREETGRVLDVLDRELGKRNYLAGAEFSLADICYMPYVEYLFAAEAGDLITSRRNVAAWWERVSSRPSWKTATGKAA